MLPMCYGLWRVPRLSLIRDDNRWLRPREQKATQDHPHAAAPLGTFGRGHDAPAVFGALGSVLVEVIAALVLFNLCLKFHTSPSDVVCIHLTCLLGTCQ